MTQKLNKWLSDRSITEVECLVPDIAGIPRGKILPADKYNKVLEEAVFVFQNMCLDRP